MRKGCEQLDDHLLRPNSHNKVQAYRRRDLGVKWGYFGMPFCREGMLAALLVCSDPSQRRYLARMARAVSGGLTFLTS